MTNVSGWVRMLNINVLESSPTHQVHPNILVQFHPKSTVAGENLFSWCLTWPCRLGTLAHSSCLAILGPGRSMDGSEEEFWCLDVFRGQGARATRARVGMSDIDQS